MQKITIKPFLFLAAFGTLLFSAGCSKDWLNPAPENELVVSDTAFNDPANAVRFVNAGYTNLLTWEQSSFAWIGVTSITSDNADKGSSPGDLGTDKDVLDALTYTATTPSFQSAWRGNYLGVAYTNQAIANVPQFDIDDNLKTRLTAEARFLRAYYYFNLVRMFGNIPLVDTVLSADNAADLDKANTQVAPEVIYAFIEQDLEFALRNLPKNTEYAAADVGRATQGAAAGLLAKVSLYQEKWSRALSLTDSIINGSVGNHSLVPDYATIWREVGENSPESLFEIQSKGTIPTAGVQQYSEVQGLRGATFNVPSSDVFSGWGFNTPSEDLDNAYEPGDVRRNATIMHVGDVLFDGVEILSAENPRHNYKAYVSRLQESFSGSAVVNKNVRLLRMGEIYLINAEAANELGQTAKALSSVNAIRARARGGVSGVVPDLTTADQGALRQAIWKERRLELAMEHDRFFDLVRTGQAGPVLRAHGKNFVEGKHERFPIPQTEIDASGGRLIQNPNY